MLKFILITIGFYQHYKDWKKERKRVGLEKWVLNVIRRVPRIYDSLCQTS